MPGRIELPGRPAGAGSLRGDSGVGTPVPQLFSVAALEGVLMFKRRRRLTWTGVAGLSAAALLAAGCGASTTPSTNSSISVKGAVATIPDITGTGANCIFPVETTNCYSVANYEDFQYLMVRPLYMFGGNSNTSISVDYSLSPADKPIYTSGGKTVVINLKPWKWSDGSPVDAKDLIFFLNMLEANKTSYAGYTPKLAPDNISSYAATGPQQVTLHLKSAYSSLWYTYNQLATFYELPLTWDVTKAGAAPDSGGCLTDSPADSWAKCRAVWNYLNSQNKDTSTYATNSLWKVVDGPFKLSTYNVDGNYTFVPNTKYSGSPKPSISELKFTEVTSDTAEYTGLKTGAYSTGDVPSTDLTPAVGKTFLPATNPLSSTPNGGYVLQAAYLFGIGYAYINYNNPVVGPIFRQLYFRQAMAMLDDQAGMNKSIGRGYSVSTDAGVPSEPSSQWISSKMKENGGQGPYPYDPAKAEALLASHGWKKVGGVLTCESPGTGAADCGAGIAKGLQAKFTMLYSSGISTQEDDVDIVKSSFGLAGIQLSPAGETFDTLLGDTTPCHGAKCTWDLLYLGSWIFNGPGFEPSGEPLFQSGVPNNSGSYTNATMNKLIAATHTSNSLSTFHAYANYTAEQEPSFWLPLGTSTVAVSNDLHHVTQNPLLVFYPEFWTCSSKSC
jgi:peptide/nickel transport system substrate-binding protein